LGRALEPSYARRRRLALRRSNRGPPPRRRCGRWLGPARRAAAHQGRLGEVGHFFELGEVTHEPAYDSLYTLAQGTDAQGRAGSLCQQGRELAGTCQSRSGHVQRLTERSLDEEELCHDLPDVLQHHELLLRINRLEQRRGLTFGQRARDHRERRLLRVLAEEVGKAQHQRLERVAVGGQGHLLLLQTVTPLHGARLERVGLGDRARAWPPIGVHVRDLDDAPDACVAGRVQRHLHQGWVARELALSVGQPYGVQCSCAALEGPRRGRRLAHVSGH
jgi:hypothetical protein